jgi:hypothetical protein
MATLIEQRTIGAIPENERQAGGPPHVSRLVRAAVTGFFALLGTAIGTYAVAVVAWLVGLFVAGGLHYVLNRSAAAADADVPVAPITATAAATA